MKAKELKIGNNVDLYGTTATVQRSDFGGKGLAVDKGKPISLTEEWLLRFGFEKVACISILYEIECNLEYIKYINIHIEENKFIVSVDNYGMEFKFKEIKYVHQLQNLYFALTGKELNEI